jgi:hypothetical protein
MSAPIDKARLAGEKAKLQYALEHAGAVPPAATAIGGFVHCVNAMPCRVTRIDSPAGLSERMGHPDDLAVDRFSAAMKEKMARARTKGRDGWDDTVGCPAARLQGMLVDHIGKGDPVDVGNLAMMLWNRGERTALLEQSHQGRQIALDEWFSKTAWVQEQADTFPLSRLGKHRADVMREEIERLRAIVASTMSNQPQADMVADLNKYSLILSILGMDEEGDPVAEVQRLFDADRAASTQCAEVASIDTPEFLGMLDSYATDGTNGYGHWHAKIIAHIKAWGARLAAGAPAETPKPDGLPAAAWVTPLRYGSQVTFYKPPKPYNWDDDEEKWYCYPLVRAAQPAGATDAQIDTHLDAVLRASGSALRHYSMVKTLADMRAAMRAAMTRSAAAGG